VVGTGRPGCVQQYELLWAEEAFDVAFGIPLAPAQLHQEHVHVVGQLAQVTHGVVMGTTDVLHRDEANVVDCVLDHFTCGVTSRLSRWWP
jgi:hypothetical protein